MRYSFICFAESLCPYSSKLSATGKNVGKFRDIPGPDSIPLVGSIDNVWNSFKKDSQWYESYSQKLLDFYEKYGPLVKEDLGFGRNHVLHVFDPVDAQTVLSADGKTPFIVPLQETTQKYREMKGMNPGLGNLNGDEWYRLRSSIQSAMMRPQSVQTYKPFSLKVVEHLVEHIRKEQMNSNVVDMKKIAGRWSLESAGQIIFEKSLGALGENSSWADYLVGLNKEIFQLSARMRLSLPIFRYFPTSSWKRMVELEDTFYHEVDKLMDEALINLKRSKAADAAEMRFASFLINQKELTEVDVKVILLSMFSDGLSTTAPMVIYNLYNIAKNEEIQNEIRSEVKNGSNKLPLLRACIKETFRMYPIGTEISRITQRDLVLSGYEVPSGTAVDINTNILMRKSVLFPDEPEKFKPSRWIKENRSTEDYHPFAFLPFGFGPRMCAGRRFAEQDLILILSHLILNFKIEHVGKDISQVYETLLLPKGDCNFIFHPV